MNLPMLDHGVCNGQSALVQADRSSKSALPDEHCGPSDSIPGRTPPISSKEAECSELLFVTSAQTTVRDFPRTARSPGKTQERVESPAPLREFCSRPRGKPKNI